MLKQASAASILVLRLRYQEKLNRIKQLKTLRQSYLDKIKEIKDNLQGLDCKSELELDNKIRDLELKISHEVRFSLYFLAANALGHQGTWRGMGGRSLAAQTGSMRHVRSMRACPDRAPMLMHLAGAAPARGEADCIPDLQAERTALPHQGV